MNQSESTKIFFNKKLHVLFAIDNALITGALKRIIQDIFPYPEFHYTHTCNGIVSRLSGIKINLLITDTELADGLMLPELEYLRMKFPDLLITIFDTYHFEMLGRRFIQSGANVFFHHNTSETEIRKTMEILAISGSFPETKLQVSKTYARSDGDVAGLLSKREYEVFLFLIKGYGVTEIAKLLNRQLSTIGTFKARIFDKLKVANIADLVRTSLRINNTTEAILVKPGRQAMQVNLIRQSGLGA